MKTKLKERLRQAKSVESPQSNDLLGRAWNLVYQHAMRTFTVCVRVEGTDTVAGWITHWLSQQTTLHQSRDLHAIDGECAPSAPESPRAIGDSCSTSSGPSMPGVRYVPAAGSHLLRYRDRPVWVVKDMYQNEFMSRPVVRYELRILGRDPQPLKDLIEDARAMCIVAESDLLSIMVPHGDYWTTGTQRLKRPLDSVFLPDGQMEALLEDVETFLADRDWYARTNVPWQRGYLLHGPPGTGKTSTVLSIASALGVSVYWLQVSAEGMTDSELGALLRAVPQGHIVLLEDIDSAFVERDESDFKASKVTFTGLLNALDGALAPPGQIRFLTSNHPERLDEALVRPGRVDLKVKVDHADALQAQGIYERFFPDAPDDLARAFGLMVGDRGVSMASIQGHLLLHRYDPNRAIERVEDLFAKAF